MNAVPARGDLRWRTIAHMVEDVSETYGDDEAIVDGDVRLTYRELGRFVDACSRGAIAAGIENGDRVAIWAPNGYQWIIAAFGVLGAGAAVVPLNTRYRGQEAAYILAKSGASTLLTVTDFLGTDYVALLRQSLADAGDDEIASLPSLRSIVVMSGELPEGTSSWAQFIEAGTQVGDELLRGRRAEIEPGFLSDILFTSGTTGKPKGVMLTHAQTLRVFADWSSIIGLRAGDRSLIVNPFFHVFGCKAGFLSSIMRGAVVIPQRVFEVRETMALIERERVTMYPGPPTIHQTILDHPDRDRYDLSSLRLCATGAADVPVEMLRRMREELSYETIVTGYGLTECTGTATMSRHDDDPELISRSSGRAIPDVEVRVVDDAMNTLPAGEQGEIVVRGYNVMSGYYDDPEQTAQVVTTNGWLLTGDLGVMDEDGYLSITGRKKDMYIVGGFNTYPAEIEGQLLRHEAIAQVAVVGVPDARLGEVGMAWVVVKPGHEVEPEAIIAWARERLANYKVPRHVRLVDALPTNAAGKVTKFELAAQGAALLTGA
jgi:acyl-CoA synthetase (AMP-forming)/AMP-acid ligase II